MGLETHYKKNTDGSYQKLSQIETHYNDKTFDASDLHLPNTISHTTAIPGLKYYGPSCAIIGATLPVPYPNVKFYETVSEWWRMTERKDRMFNQSNENLFTETTTNYFYDETADTDGVLIGSMQLIKEELTDIHGLDHISEYTYPADYDNSQTWLDEMKSRHMHAYPIEITTRTEDGSSTNYLSGIFNEYEFNSFINTSGTPSGAVVPKRTYALETDGSNLTSFSSSVPVGTPDSKFEARIVFDSYDDKGNLLQVKKESGQAVSYLYTYDQTLPAAQIINAESNEIAYTSFEQVGEDSPLDTDLEDGSWHIKRSVGGGWTIGTDNKKTGLQGFELQPNNRRYLEQNDVPTGEYILSFWHKGGIVDISVSGNLYSVPADSEGSFYELAVSLVQGQPLTIKAAAGVWNAYIDELRLFPIDAQMSSICYDERLRVHTITDANGRSSYYQYDEFGRLQYVRDQDGNYVQKFSYHLQEN